MASADSCQFNRSSLCGLSVAIISDLLARSPRVRTITFIPYTCCIYSKGFGQYRTSFCLANSSAPHKPYMQFLFIRPKICRRLPSDSSSRRTPLPLANTSCCQVCSGLSPYSYRPCRAHQKNLDTIVYQGFFVSVQAPQVRDVPFFYNAYNQLYTVACFRQVSKNTPLCLHLLFKGNDIFYNIPCTSSHFLTLSCSA